MQNLPYHRVLMLWCFSGIFFFHSSSLFCSTCKPEDFSNRTGPPSSFFHQSQNRPGHKLTNCGVEKLYLSQKGGVERSLLITWFKNVSRASTQANQCRSLCILFSAQPTTKPNKATQGVHLE